MAHRTILVSQELFSQVWWPAPSLTSRQGWLQPVWWKYIRLAARMTYLWSSGTACSTASPEQRYTIIFKWITRLHQHADTSNVVWQSTFREFPGGFRAPNNIYVLQEYFIDQKLNFSVDRLSRLYCVPISVCLLMKKISLKILYMAFPSYVTGMTQTCTGLSTELFIY